MWKSEVKRMMDHVEKILDGEHPDQTEDFGHSPEDKASMIKMFFAGTRSSIKFICDGCGKEDIGCLRDALRQIRDSDESDLGVYAKEVAALASDALSKKKAKGNPYFCIEAPDCPGHPSRRRESRETGNS